MRLNTSPSCQKADLALERCWKTLTWPALLYMGGLPGLPVSLRTINKNRTQQLGQAEVTENATKLAVQCSGSHWIQYHPVYIYIIYMNKPCMAEVCTVKSCRSATWSNSSIVTTLSLEIARQQSVAPTGSPWKIGKLFGIWIPQPLQLPPFVHHWIIRFFYKFKWKWSRNMKKHQETDS